MCIFNMLTITLYVYNIYIYHYTYMSISLTLSLRLTKVQRQQLLYQKINSGNVVHNKIHIYMYILHMSYKFKISLFLSLQQFLLQRNKHTQHILHNFMTILIHMHIQYECLFVQIMCSVAAVIITKKRTSLLIFQGDLWDSKPQGYVFSIKKKCLLKNVTSSQKIDTDNKKQISMTKCENAVDIE